MEPSKRKENIEKKLKKKEKKKERKKINKNLYRMINEQKDICRKNSNSGNVYNSLVLLHRYAADGAKEKVSVPR